MILFEEGRTGQNTAAFNLAMEEFIFREILLRKKGGEYFRLWQNKNAVIIGRNQNAYSEINEEYVNKNGIEVIRRMTGGGAVYHDLGNLNFSFFTSSGSGAARVDFKRFMNPIVLALKEIGINAEISGRNDLVAYGKKFSGNAQLIKDGKILHHGTILVNSNLDVLRKALNVSDVKLRSKAVASVRSRVVNLSEIAGLNSETRLNAEALTKLITEHLPIDSVYAADRDDFEAVHRLAVEKYSTREWNYGTKPVYDCKKESYIDGLGKIEVYFKIKDDIIETCKIYGDFFDSGRVGEAESSLKGRRLRDVKLESLDLIPKPLS